MKIFKIKRMLFAVLTVVICISSLSFFQSCSNNEEISKASKASSAVESRIQEISENKIPRGVKPIVLKNKEELYKLLEKLDSVNLKVVSLKRNTPRFKVFPETGSTSTTASLATNYDITIDLAWSHLGDNITVESHNTNTWYFSSWTQNTGVASWSGNSKINYDITGTVKFYAIVSWQLWELSRGDMHVSGYING